MTPEQLDKLEEINKNVIELKTILCGYNEFPGIIQTQKDQCLAISALNTRVTNVENRAAKNTMGVLKNVGLNVLSFAFGGGLLAVILDILKVTP